MTIAPDPFLSALRATIPPHEDISPWITDRWAIPTVLALCVVAGVMLGIGGIVADVVGLALFGAATQMRPRA